jgi:hypothetical protein
MPRDWINASGISANSITTQESKLQVASSFVSSRMSSMLAWIGRGTYEAGEWQEALNQARAAHNTHTAEYLVGLPLLGDYLEEGLAASQEARGTVVVRSEPRSKSSGFGRNKTK